MPRMAVPLPISGEIYYVDMPDFVDPLEVKRQAEADEAAAKASHQGHQVSGMMQCRNCGQGFGNNAALKQHVDVYHRQAAGIDDMRPVEMPDGTLVPAFKVHELKAQDQEKLLGIERVARMQFEEQVKEQLKHKSGGYCDE